jgi:hypothetical protein
MVQLRRGITGGFVVIVCLFLWDILDAAACICEQMLLYLKRCMKTVFAFHSNLNSLRHGFTLDKTGNNLPLVNRESWWVFFKVLIIHEQTQLLGASAKDMLNGIEKRGYYITEDKIYDCWSS